MKQLWKVNQELILEVKPAFCDRSPIKARRCGLPVMRYFPSQVTYQENKFLVQRIVQRIVQRKVESGTLLSTKCLGKIFSAKTSA